MTAPVLNYTEIMVSLNCLASHWNLETNCRFRCLVQVLIWTLWGTALATTVFRTTYQFILQRRLYADDHFVLVGMLVLTGLSAVITRLLPHFYLVGEYTKAAVLDPLTPLPMPPDEFQEKTSLSLQLMFSQMLLFWTTLWAGESDPD